MKKLGMIVAICLLSGCVSWQQVVKTETIAADKSFKVDLPMDWMSFKGGADDVLVTNTGMGLEMITVNHYKFNEAFKTTKVVIDKETLIPDLIDYYVADVKKRNSDLTVSVVKQSLTLLAGQDAFEVELEFKNDKGLRYTQITQGMVTDKGFFEVSLRAPKLHYFNESYDEYKSILQSFALL